MSTLEIDSNKDGLQWCAKVRENSSDRGYNISIIGYAHTAGVPGNVYAVEAEMLRVRISHAFPSVAGGNSMMVPKMSSVSPPPALTPQNL